LNSCGSRHGAVVGYCEHGNETPGFIKPGISSLAENIFVYVRLRRGGYDVPEMNYCKRTCIRAAYSPSSATHSAQRCCHCWKHFSESCCGISFSTVVI